MKQYKELFFFLTQQCPHRCKYCYIDYNSSDMSISDIDSYIEEYNPSRIIFFGGEPLLRLDLIKYTVKKYYGKIKFQVVTSTCANFKEFIEFHKKYPLNEVQLSWDGYTDSRIDINGNSIAKKVLDNIYYAIGQGITFDIKCVINNHNVSQLREMHDTFKKMKPLGANGEIIIAHAEDYTEEFYTELKKNLLYTFDLDKMYADNMNKLCAYISHDNSYCSCDIGKYHTISTSGMYNNCTAMSQLGVYLDDDKCQSRCTHKDCMKCPYSSICDGGCRYERYLKYKDKWQENYLPSTCKIMKIYANTIKQFLQSLSNEDKNRLLKDIMKYKNWMYKSHT